MQSSRSKAENSPVDVVANLVDAGSFSARDTELEPGNPLAYPGYEAAIAAARERVRAGESAAAGPATIDGVEVELATFDFSFFGGSMGEVAGERLARSLGRAAEDRRPFILVSSTGGARMQEGMRALVQMPKVVAARLDLARAHQPYIAVLGHPTTGGVLASLGALADFTLAQSSATIGFAGPRVVEAFTGRRLRSGSHTAEAALEHGLVDAVFDAAEMRSAIARLLHLLRDPLAGDGAGKPVAGEPVPLDAWAQVQRARSDDRPRGRALLEAACDDLFELRGDRAGRDDRAVLAALGYAGAHRAVFVALDRTLPPGPAGFRKARRCVGMAARLDLPVVTLVDTPGADPSEDSEAGGIAWEIARLFESMLSAPVPILSVVTGEGGSGGALAFATGDVLVAYAGAVFSVIGPEAAAQILWRDDARAPEAASLLKVGAADLVALGVADAVVRDSEPLKNVVAYHLERLTNDAQSPGERVARRRSRWRNK